MTTWDERFRTGDYPENPDPSPRLRAYVDSFPDGRALDVATGTGRNALFLAERGYEVDALDRSIEGLRIARRTAEERGVDADVNWIRGDATTYEFPASTYDVITVSFFRTLDRLGDVKAALRPGGVLFYQHHLRAADPVDVGPRTDRYRFRSNELLRACLDLTVLRYDERLTEDDGRTAADVTVVARNSTGGSQRYPRPDDGPAR
jgi:SAM-dependent methyltransferase